MLLLIDVGNTNIVFGVYKNNKQVGSFRLTSNVTRTSDVSPIRGGKWGCVQLTWLP